MLRTYGVTQRRGAAASDWARPADWLALPEVFAGEQRITALFAVFDHSSNFVAFTISGAYTVDWGDGTVENFAAGATAQRNYSYSALGAGTLSTLGYRQAIITITPQAGQNFTSVNFGVKHSQAGLQNNYSAGWLEINMAGSLISTLTIADYVGMLRRFNFPGTNVLTSLANFCRGASSLASFSMSTTGVSNFGGFLLGCTSISALPAINTAAGNNFSNFCRGCTSLSFVSAINTALGADLSNFLFGCSSLPVLPAISLSAATNLSNFCSGCLSLSRSQATGTSRTISYANMKLGQSELVEIFNNLATVTGQTITISGNWGASLLTAGERAIATNKGWTIVG